MTEHYANEVKSERRSHPLDRVLYFHSGCQQPSGFPASSPAGQEAAAAQADAGTCSKVCSSSSEANHQLQLQYHQQYHQHPGLPLSAPSGTHRDILLLESPQWLPDSYASHCGGCQLPFRPLLRLRHHCRLCGKLFCHSCSSKQLLLPPRFKERDPQRVCAMCASLLEPLQPFLVGATAASVQLPVHDALDAISLRSWLNSPWTSCMSEELYKAANILRNFNEAFRLEPEQGLPATLLAGACGVALLSVVRLGAGWSCTAGTGVVISRERSGSWSAPCAAACYGLGWGLQIGGQLTDVLLVLRTEEAVRAFASGQTIGFGGTAGVSLGPLGRTAEASMRVGGLAARGSVVGYSCSKGAFIGVSLDSSVTCVRAAVNQKFYGYAVTARQLLVDCTVPNPPAALLLYDGLDSLVQRWEGRGLLLHSKAAHAAPAAASSTREAATSQAAAATASKGSAAAARKQHQQAAQYAPDDEYAHQLFNTTVASAVASAPPAPAGMYPAVNSSSNAAAAATSRSSSWQQQQQHPSLWNAASASPAEALPAVPALPAAHRHQEDDDEEPQYVLEW
eukprot:GHRR01010241.1.p1 GENE.GHRR01010241.1~~GHRR01010241.1.p1  ORF type:complete len:565 (+),score=243.91 GHRR01010241.1:902-2596(+)